jgi:uncharacterized protein
MRNQAGSPVEGDEFFGREAELNYLNELLEHQDVLLLGPRRVGKTSVARRLCCMARGKGQHAFEVNVASCEDEAVFVEKLMEAVQENSRPAVVLALSSLWSGFGERLNRIKKLKVSAAGGALETELAEKSTEHWTKIAGDLLRKLADLEGGWLIYVDELPIFLYKVLKEPDGEKRVRLFLDWFRNDIRDKIPAITWLVSGSVGLDTLVQRYRMPDTINNMSHQHLDPFSPDEADTFLTMLSDTGRLDLTPEQRQQILQGIGWTQPYYIQLVVQNLLKPGLKLRHGSTCRIRAALERVIDPETDNDFHHWEGRLDDQLGKPDAILARELLSVVARDPKGATGRVLLNALSRSYHSDPGEQKTKYSYLRDILLRDAYLWEDQSTETSRYRFRFELLRLWWIRRKKI